MTAPDNCPTCGKPKCTKSACDLTEKYWTGMHHKNRCHGHAPKAIDIGLPQRFFSFIRLEDSCWIWEGSTAGSGYGKFKFKGVRKPAHRYAYEAEIGPIPAGYHLDHLCRNRACVNPTHLEAVTARENIHRGKNVKCNHAPNRMSDRHCRDCHRVYEKARRDRVKKERTDGR